MGIGEAKEALVRSGYMILGLVSYTDIVIVTETVLLEIVTIEAVLTAVGNQALLLQGWSHQYRRPITLAELDEITRNLAHFFSVMLSWEQQFKQQGLIPEKGESEDAHV